MTEWLSERVVDNDSTRDLYLHQVHNEAKRRLQGNSKRDDLTGRLLRSNLGFGGTNNEPRGRDQRSI
jgi:hypothetical protein